MQKQECFNYEKYYAKSINISWLSVDIWIRKFAHAKGPFISIHHSHDLMELCYVISGSGSMRVEKMDYIPLKKGTLLYLAAGVNHHLISDSSDPIQVCIMPFSISPCATNDNVPACWVKDELSLLENLKNNKILLAEDTFGCDRELQNIILFMESSYKGEYVKLKNNISNFLMNALMAFACDRKPFNFQAIINDNNIFQNIIDFMRKHFAEGITVTSMAKALHYSPRQCQRMIRDIMGISFSELLLDIKISHVKEQLRNTNQTLGEIAYNSGFKSGRSLTKQFKNKEGITPSQYRNKYDN